MVYIKEKNTILKSLYKQKEINTFSQGEFMNIVFNSDSILYLNKKYDRQLFLYKNDISTYKPTKPKTYGFIPFETEKTIKNDLSIYRRGLIAYNHDIKQINNIHNKPIKTYIKYIADEKNYIYISKRQNYKDISPKNIIKEAFLKHKIKKSLYNTFKKNNKHNEKIKVISYLFQDIKVFSDVITLNVFKQSLKNGYIDLGIKQYCETIKRMLISFYSNLKTKTNKSSMSSFKNPSNSININGYNIILRKDLNCLGYLPIPDDIFIIKEEFQARFKTCNKIKHVI